MEHAGVEEGAGRGGEGPRVPRERPDAVRHVGGKHAWQSWQVRVEVNCERPGEETHEGGVGRQLGDGDRDPGACEWRGCRSRPAAGHRSPTRVVTRTLLNEGRGGQCAEGPSEAIATSP